MTDSAEEWRAIPGFEGDYEVSTMGRIRSLDREVWRNGPQYSRPHLVRYRGRIRPTYPQKHGYMTVMLWQSNRYRTFRVHRLVLDAFVGPCPAGMETLHRNGVRSDNRLANLRWGTPAENAADQLRHGTRRGRPRKAQAGVPGC